MKDNWDFIMSSNDQSVRYDYYLRKGSFIHQNGKSTILVQQLANDSASRPMKVFYYQAEISDSTCNAGYGKINFNDTTGKLLQDFDYISNGESNSSVIGDLVCGMRNTFQREGKI